MDYTVRCECGRNINVPASSAGTDVLCNCGRRLAVPLLSELRSSSGEDPYGRNTAAKIARMIRNAELPSGEICAVTGRPTKDIALFLIECERVLIQDTGWDDVERTAFATAIRFLFLGALGVLFRIPRFGRFHKLRREHGHQVVVSAPLYICCDMHAELKRRSQKALKGILGEIPIYATLLKEYPNAVVSFAKSLPNDGTKRQLDVPFPGMEEQRCQKRMARELL